jgi:hypothetical protein
MIIRIYDHIGPVGKVLIDIQEKGLIKWHDFICGLTFHKDGVYKERIKQIADEYANDKNKLLVVVNDVSKHSYPNRVSIRVMDLNQNENE